jgi:hypothetical protein
VPEIRAVQVARQYEASGCRIEELEIAGLDGDTIGAIFSRPAEATRPVPAVLYLHAHGNRYEIGCRELVEGRPSLQNPPYAFALAAEGIAALCLDMPTFGRRSNLKESELAKRHLWRGTTLFGAMLRDLQIGLDVLTDRPDVDAQRIGAFGLSMGATGAYWLAAIDSRVQSIAHLCCFADLDWLVQDGEHDLHGIYMMVPGLLAHVSTGEIAALVAPRPQLCCVGLVDPLTPEPAVTIAAKTVAARYRDLGASANWSLHTEEKVGHRETENMRSLVLRHFRGSL